MDGSHLVYPLMTSGSSLKSHSIVTCTVSVPDQGTWPVSTAEYGYSLGHFLSGSESQAGGLRLGGLTVV